MACGARSGLKPYRTLVGVRYGGRWLNGLWSPFGFETVGKQIFAIESPRLNGLGSPFGCENRFQSIVSLKVLPGEMACVARAGLRHLSTSIFPQMTPVAKWPVEPVRV